jgi:hypothetical protein
MAVVDFGMDWSPLAKLGDTYRQAQERDQTQQWLQQQGLPGNMNLAQLALQQQAVQRGEARDTRDFGFRQQEAQRTQANQDRAFALQKQSAEEAARGFETREIDDGMGGKRLVRIEKATGKVTALPIEGDAASATPNNPFAQGKMNDEQAKAGLYSSRMMNAEKVLGDPSVVAAAGDITQVGRSKIPVLGNYLVSDNFQKFDQAKRDFINATLRRESGAAIASSEFENAEKQYFPQPGDSAEKLAQKKANRIEAIRGIASAAGPGYRPEHTFDDQGGVIPNPAPKRGAPQPQPQQFNWKTRETIMGARQNAEATIAQAKEAIAKGMPPAEAMKRLQAAGIPVDPATFGGAPAAPNPANFGFGN